jgi:hypothetical protein
MNFFFYLISWYLFLPLNQILRSRAKEKRITQPIYYFYIHFWTCLIYITSKLPDSTWHSRSFSSMKALLQCIKRKEKKAVMIIILLECKCASSCCI